ncbi:MAG TPA: hypothetical protein VKB27_12035 [Gammaproteobacteria bacterium]|nr:hypothetical protein [Gammaproteobacteria bacterium]
MMILRIILVAAAILTVSCSGPSNSNSQEQVQELKEVNGAGVSFIYRTNDFDEVEIKKEGKLMPPDMASYIDEGFAPEHFCFRLKDKRPLPAFEQGPRYFFPARSFICAIPLKDSSVKDFGGSYPSLNWASGVLQKILRERPDEFEHRRDVPDIPANNAGPSILSRFQYLDFRSGSGILFLTQYSQEYEPNPVNNEELTLVFQGRTKDGRYYVAARLAITHPSLPRGIDFTDEIERDMQWRYLRKTEKELEELSEESFQPSLKSLKAMLSSIYVE